MWYSLKIALNKPIFMTRRGKFIFGLIIFVFVALVAFNIYRDKAIKDFFKNMPQKAATISTVKAKLKNWSPTLDAVGNLTAMHGVDVNAQSSGNVMDIHFKSGQYVNKGQPLVTIDDRVEQAQLKYNLAELDLKKLSFNRQEKLFKKGAAPGSNLDEARANLQQAEANVEKITAQIQQKHIVAPFAGKLGIRLINLGQYISTGQTAIVTLQSLDPLFLEFYLPEQKLKKIYVGQPIRFYMSEYPNLIFTGKITAINAKVNIKTHNVKVQATVPNCPTEALKNPLQSSLVKAKKEHNSARIIISCQTDINEKQQISNFSFIPGMFASIEVSQPVIPKQVVLPATAIAYSLYGDSVYIIKKRPGPTKESKPELYVQQLFVRTGDQQGNEIVVTHGVKPGDEVVSSGQLKLQNGTLVKINNKVKMPDVKDIDKLGQ